MPVTIADVFTDRKMTKGDLKDTQVLDNDFPAEYNGEIKYQQKEERELIEENAR